LIGIMDSPTPTPSPAALPDRLRGRAAGLRCYGLTPPKRGLEEARLRAIAERQSARVAELAPDALILYDLQEEPGRAGGERPFPFLPTLEPMEYADGFLSGLAVPRIHYKCVANLDRGGFAAWLRGFPAARDACVLVGAPSSRHAGGLPLAEAYALLSRSGAAVACGGVAIAERHARKGDEDERLFAKHAAGCAFFVSQTVYDADGAKSLLSDYALRFARAGTAPPPILLSFSPCGSLKTMEFMKWLGIAFPRWLENELRHSPDILAKSVELAARNFADILAFAREKGLPVGINVESVSIRKEEIDASCELFRRLSGILGNANATR
jgi:hypothetical protein